MVRVHARAHLDLLLLAVVAGDPGDGAAVIREVHEQSGGRFTIGSGTVYPALHRLERNRLIRRPRENPRRYVLTTAGQRSLAAKQQEWDAFVQGVQALLPPSDRQDGTGRSTTTADSGRGSRAP